MFKFEDKIKDKLNSKMFSIHVTNVCNLSCGGCDQFCGYFDKDRLWFISLEELKENIESFKAYARQNWSRPDFPEEEKVCLIYGGEPTLHPKFEEMLELFRQSPEYPFVIYTNGRTFAEQFKNIDMTVLTCREVSAQVYLLESLPKNGDPKFARIFKRFHSHEGNIGYRIDYKTREFRTLFVPTLCAPADLEKNENLDRMDYVERAKNCCYQWNQCECAIYKNKAYACHVAASMDYMFFDGEHGWEVEPGKNPFNKSKDQIEKQLSHFCYRCGYNHKGGLKNFEIQNNMAQYTHKGSMITKTNYEDIDKSKDDLLKVIQPSPRLVPLEVFR